MNYLAKIPESKLEDLGAIRHWSHLKMARKDSEIWVSGFSKEQINSNELKCIPFIELFQETDSKLYPLGKRVPIAKIDRLIWTPITNGLTIDPIQFNHNLFEIKETINWRLQASSKTQDTFALKIKIIDFQKSVENAPKIRLNHLKWTVSNDQTVLVLGSPPLSTRYVESYWLSRNNLIPMGYDFDLKVLENEISNSIENDNADYILWDKSGGYQIITNNVLESVSRSSVKKTLNRLSDE
ncbi:MAG: hypothetical protein NXI20_06295 [bacterium]|nr:hypothetical protein [bacterium]